MFKIIERLNKFLPANSFRKNVAVMFSGTIISQIIYLLFYPFLTRIYSTANFGQYAIFLSFLSILGVLATGQYELTILLPKKERILKLLVYGAISLSVLMSVLISVGLFFAFPLLDKYNYFNSYGVVIFLGLSVFVYTLYQIGFYLSLRSRDFKSLAWINIIQVSFTILVQFVLSKTGFENIGLLIGYMFGMFIAAIILLIREKKVFFKRNKISKIVPEIKQQLIRYRKFPLFNLPATFVNLFANQVPQLMLNTFGQSVVGHFALSQRILGSPVTLFSTSISHVFKERASSDYRENGNCTEIFVQTFKNLFLISVIPFILIFIFAPMAVPIIFGSQWGTAGIYIRALTIMYFLKFSVSPLTYVIIIAEKQNLNLLLQLLLLFMTVIAIYFGLSQKNSLMAVTMYAISYSIVYLIFFTVSYRLSKGIKKD